MQDNCFLYTFRRFKSGIPSNDSSNWKSLFVHLVVYLGYHVSQDDGDEDTAGQEPQHLEDAADSTPAFPCGSLYHVKISLELQVTLQLSDPLVQVGRVHLLHGAHGDTHTGAD